MSCEVYITYRMQFEQFLEITDLQGPQFYCDNDCATCSGVSFLNYTAVCNSL